MGTESTLRIQIRIAGASTRPSRGLNPLRVAARRSFHHGLTIAPKHMGQRTAEPSLDNNVTPVT
ncbi:hypothetical protein Pd630_LPD16100 (plasmid) [Rhodococcus opacus PD630]|nr:hypothetical protein Pd630_LPD16100 [Rhodococcus opacus PD630]